MYLSTVGAVGHCRDALRLGTTGMLCGSSWGDAVGHCGMAGVLSGWALLGWKKHSDPYNIMKNHPSNSPFMNPTPSPGISAYPTTIELDPY